MKCTKCGKEIDIEKKFCKYCGTPIEKAIQENKTVIEEENKSVKSEKVVKCQNCGQKTYADRNFCIHCGNSLVGNNNSANHKRKGEHKWLKKVGIAFAFVIILLIIIVISILCVRNKIDFAKLESLFGKKEASAVGNSDNDIIHENSVLVEEKEDAIIESENEYVSSEAPEELSAVDKAKKYQEYFVNGMEPLEYNGHAYAIIDYEDIQGLNKMIPSFEEWEELANLMGGYLAVIDDAEENEFIYDKVLGSQGFTGAFFGYTDRDNEGEWHWVNGSTSTYTNWNQVEDRSHEIYVQPNNGSSSPDHIEEDYAQFYRVTADGTWNDARPGENTHKFVVEWE